MKAAVVPAASGSWQIKDVPQPQPGPGQVLVKMHASGICYTDVHQTLGHLPGSFLESLAMSQWARSLAWLLMLPLAGSATASGRHGFSRHVDAANGANAAEGCSALT